MVADLNICEIKRSEYQLLSELMVDVYSSLEGFPSQLEQPDYYATLINVGRLNEDADTRVLVAVSSAKGLVGGVVYFSDMSRYGSGGTATREKNASGIRLLCVDPESRGMGVGKALTDACIQLAKDHGHSQVILHTTQAMQVAWRMYLKMGFERSADLDFSPQENFTVYGFRLGLTDG